LVEIQNTGDTTAVKPSLRVTWLM